MHQRGKSEGTNEGIWIRARGQLLLLSIIISYYSNMQNNIFLT